MRRLLVVAGTMLSMGLLAPAGAAADGGPQPLSQPRPAWLTPALEAKIVAAGPRGVEVALGKRGQTLEPGCLGYAPPYAGADGVSPTAVSAGTCMVAPQGCSANYVFTDGASHYLGTAGHCLVGGGTVIAQIGTRVDPTDTVLVTLAAIGKSARKWNGGIGKDFGLIKIDPRFKVVPGVAGALGPTGVFCGDPVGQPVMHYGHGYVFFVSQGNPKFGQVIPDSDLLLRYDDDRGFGWVGYGLPGDSGSGVANDAGLAVGDLTHGIGVGGIPVPGLNFGTEMRAIFELIGRGYSLVTADGRRVRCEPGALVDVA